VLNSVYNTPDEQQDLITLHQQDGSLIRALPHADPNCGTIGMNRSGWDWLKSLAERFLAPTPAHAATRNALLHVGAGGETGVLGAKCGPPPEPAPGRVPGIMLTTTCPPQSPMRRSGPRGSPMATVTPPKTVSDFQFALPAKMDYLNRGDADRTAPAGTALPTAVKVTDWDGTAVQGARVTFTEPGEPDGTIIGTATSGSDGVAQILWTIKTGPNTVVASGRGIAAQNNYPNATVKPFMPDISLPTDQQRPVALGTGRVTFFATGVTGGFTPQTVLTGLEYPKGLWISHFDAYLTETAGHNTTFGGKTTLLHWTPDGRILQTLLTNPVNSDAVVVTEDGSIYLAGYVGSSPGEQGRVSRASFTGAAGWVETPVTDVAIAAQDMFLDENEDIYLIGPSDDQEATNIYRLPSGSYDSPVGLATGLGRTWSLVKIGSTIYYSLITSGEVWALSDVGNALLFTNSSAVTSLTSDGTFLYYGDIGGTIRRLNLSTGADELVTTGPGAINAVRYDPSSGRLYYLRSGTADAQYKDGTLNYITVNTPSP
jgi:WD40 repeat protein